MHIKFIEGKPVLFTKACGRVKSWQQLFDACCWRVRCWRHYRWVWFSKLLIKTLTWSLLKRSNIYMSHMKRHGKKPYVEKLQKPHKSIFYRRVGGEYYQDTCYYSMKMSVAEYAFWGNSEYEVYLNFIKRVVGTFQFPFCVSGGPIGMIRRARYRKED